MKKCMKTLGSLSIVAVFGLAFTPWAAAWDLTFPSDCPGAAQDCVDAICADGGGTLHIEPGTHQLGPAVAPPFASPNGLFVNCSKVKIKGAGIGVTILDATDSAAPLPFIDTGALPTQSDRFKKIEVSHMTIDCGSNCNSTAVSSAGTEKVRLHHLELIGFRTGVFSIASNSVRVHDNIIVGRGPGPSSRGIRFSDGFNSFPCCDLPEKTLTRGHKVHDNLIVETSTGIRADAIVDSKISDNVIDGGDDHGMRIKGGNNLEVEGNRIRGTEGVRIETVDNSELEDNLICDTTGTPAIRFEASDADDLVRYAHVYTDGNASNELEDNLLLGYDPTCRPDGICFLPGGDGGGNEIEDNVSDPNGSCALADDDDDDDD